MYPSKPIASPILSEMVNMGRSGALFNGSRENSFVPAYVIMARQAAIVPQAIHFIFFFMGA